MWRLLMGTALLLSGCGSKSLPNAANETAHQPEPVNVANTSDRERARSADSLDALPPASAALRFVGTWATSQANCPSKSWRFSADEITAADGWHCSIYKISKVPGGYDLAAQCPAKKPVPTDLIKVRFAESARAMLVESNAISPMGLVYCGK